MKTTERVYIWVDVIRCLLLSFFGIRGKYLTPDQTVDVILSGKSLIRFGDGELGIYRQKSIHYQDYSEKLEEAFLKIKNDYESNKNCRYLLAMPVKFMTVNGFSLMKKRVYVSSWSQSRYHFKKYFKHDIYYGDAFLFEKGNTDIYKRIWTEDDKHKNVIFVHNNPKYAVNFERSYGKKVFFVQIPPRNAFESLDEIKAAIDSTISENDLSVEDTMLTISAGSAGKVLIFDFSQNGYLCVDAGHCWDDPLEGI